MSHKLRVGFLGRVRPVTKGGASISYNKPFPCVNGRAGGGSSTMQGVVEHTMVGNLPGTITVFNRVGYNASAFFGVSQSGHIHQFGPIGKNWEVWAQAAGNPMWYSIEFADDGNPDNPLTDAQILAGAQLVELLSDFAGFPLQEADTVDGQGLGVHYMGGAAWGGHTCPDLPPRHVRSHQRSAILDKAKAIRDGSIDAPPPAPVYQVVQIEADGKTSLYGYVHGEADTMGRCIWRTITSRKVGKAFLAYLTRGDWHAPLPNRCVLFVREKVSG